MEAGRFGEQHSFGPIQSGRKKVPSRDWKGQTLGGRGMWKPSGRADGKKVKKGLEQRGTGRESHKERIVCEPQRMEERDHQRNQKSPPPTRKAQTRKICAARRLLNKKGAARRTSTGRGGVPPRKEESPGKPPLLPTLFRGKNKKLDSLMPFRQGNSGMRNWQKSGPPT